MILFAESWKLMFEKVKGEALTQNRAFKKLLRRIFELNHCILWGRIDDEQ